MAGSAPHPLVVLGAGRSPLFSGGSSSDRADSLAANDALDAAVVSQIQLAADAAAADAEAVVSLVLPQRS